MLVLICYAVVPLALAVVLEQMDIGLGVLNNIFLMMVMFAAQALQPGVMTVDAEDVYNRSASSE